MRNFLLLCLCLTVSACSLLRNQPSNRYSSRERSMIMDGAADEPMRVFKITSYQDSLLLRQQSRPVIANPDDPTLQRFVDRLYATVTDSNSLGVGIAAPQVGILRNIIWVQRFDKENFPFEVYLNPVIRQYSDLTQPCLEGCLSIPGRRDTTTDRAYAILLEYDRMDGSHEIEMVEDFTAVIFQHEIDHLNGILYLDHLQQEIEQAR